METSAKTNIDKLNHLTAESAKDALTRCCGSSRWVEQMEALRPFGNYDQLLDQAAAVWARMGEPDWLEAFSHHPRIGEDLESLRARFAATSTWSANEQQGVNQACEETLLALRHANEQYYKKYGFIFIVFATGKSATEMLAILQSRINNDREAELRIAAAEQGKITQRRLEMLCRE